MVPSVGEGAAEATLPLVAGRCPSAASASVYPKLGHACHLSERSGNSVRC
jgi:hypothetical protein